MTSLDNVTQTLEQIGRVHSSLLQLRDEVGASNPNLFRVLCEGPLDMLADLHRDLERELELGETEEVAADLWIRLEGPTIRDHAAPASILVAILDAFRTGVTAVGELLACGRLSSRPTASIKRATDLRVVGLAPGSLQIALAAPDVPHQLQLGVLDGHPEDQGDLAERAVRTLLQVADWAAGTSDHSDLERLSPDPDARRVCLSALQRILPRPRGDLSLVEFRGALVPTEAGRTIRLRKDTNQRVTEALDRAIHERMVTHEGVLRGIDLDQTSIRIRSVDEVGEVSGSFPPELLETAVHALDRPVRVTGIVRAGEGRRGLPRLEITRLEILEEADAD